jgi:hypothetical protein
MREDSGVAPGLTSLPSGGGGISPLGARFEPDLVRGSGSYSVPLQCPKGPNELRPTLSLTYSSGSGNGPFGLGWRLNVPRIERATDRGIPRYTDGDTFSIGDADTLVAVGGGRYRPSSDSRNWLIERVGDAWRIRTGEGRTLMFGRTPDSRESESGRVFAWCLDQETDAAGNSIAYRYVRDGGRLYVSEIEYSIFRLALGYEPRADILRNGRAGFMRITALRVRSIELHCSRLAPTLMRTYALAYEGALNGVTLLTHMTLSGTRDGETAAFPQLRFEYSSVDFTAWQVSELQALLPPPGLDDADTQLVDMTGDAVPDVLVSAGQRMLLWRNSGDGWLDGPTALDGVPSAVSLDRPNVALADLTGNGRADLFAADQPLSVVFETNGRGGFAPQPVVFSDQPTMRLDAADTRLMDLDGDGVTDLIRTGPDAFLLFRHEPGAGWQEPRAVRRVSDLEQFPDVSLADRGVVLADMTGDGLQDFVSVQSGDLSYWPYLGHGVWGVRVQMGNPPRFPDGYRRERVQVVDLDGDGCSDVVYMDFDSTLIWVNQAGVRFADPVRIPVTPAGNGARVIAADFYGDGRPGFAWSASPGRENGTGYRFLRFDPGRPAYLLIGIENGMGGHSQITYANTTVMRLADRADGRGWPGQLPMVVQVVAEIADADEITGRTDERSFRYHDGVFDGPRREFRGFSSVTVDSRGDDSVPASRQVFDYFQGDPEATDLLDRDRQRALAGALTAARIYGHVNGGYVLREESVQQWDARLEYNGAGVSVFFPFLNGIETREHSREPGTPTRIERSLYSDYDDTGNMGTRSRESLAEGDPPDQWIRSQETYQYTRNAADWIVRLATRIELRDGAGVPFAVRVTYYDGDPFTGLPEGQASRGLITRMQELRLLDVRLPADYTTGRDLTSLGFEHQGTGDTSGYYSTAMSVRRDPRGNVAEQKDPLGASLLFTFDGDGVYPASATDALGRTTSLTFDPRAGEPEKIAYADGRSVRYEHDAVGRLTASFETDDEGAEQLVKRWVLDLVSRPVCVTSVCPDAGRHSPGEFTTATDFASLDGAVVSRVYYDGQGAPALQVSTAPDTADGERQFMTAQRDLLNLRTLAAVEFAPQFVATLDYTPFPAADASAARIRYDVMSSREETFGPGPVHHRVVRDNFTITHYDGDAAGPFGAADPPGPASRVERFDARSRLYRIEEAKSDGTWVATSYDLTLDGHIEVVRDNSDAEVTRYTSGGPDHIVRIANREAGTRTYYRDATDRLRERVNAMARGSSLAMTRSAG